MIDKPLTSSKTIYLSDEEYFSVISFHRDIAKIINKTI